MESELENEGLALEVRILGINLINNELSSSMCTHSDLPYLQDVASEHVWQDWDVTNYDVFIVSEDNVSITKYNVSPPGLMISGNYYELKQLISNAAGK